MGAQEQRLVVAGVGTVSVGGLGGMVYFAVICCDTADYT